MGSKGVVATIPGLIEARGLLVEKNLTGWYVRPESFIGRSRFVIQLKGSSEMGIRVVVVLTGDPNVRCTYRFADDGIWSAVAL